MSIKETKTEVTPSEYNMVMKSFDFIRLHRKISNLEVPEKFLEFWLVSDFTTNPDFHPRDAQVLVFMYIIKLHHLTDSKVESILKTYRFNQLFYHFQVILAATLYARHHNIALEPFSIFNADEYFISNYKNAAELLEDYKKITRRTK